MITLTSPAAREIRRLQTLRGPSQRYVRLGVAAGGCAAWHYVLELVAAPVAGDRTVDSEGIQIAIATESVPYLQGLRLDYAEDLMGGGFRFQNPQAVSTCSCGHSFATAP